MEQLDGVVTKRAAWLDSKGRVMLEVGGCVIIADACAATAGDRVACRGLARAAVENTATPCYRARKTATINIIEAHDAPCQMQGTVAGVSQSRGCFWLEGGAHVLAPRWTLPAIGQTIELRGGEMTAARNYHAGAAASLRADGAPLLPTHLEKKLRGGVVEADYRALETVARREVGDAGSVLARRVAAARRIKRCGPRSAQHELLAAFFPAPTTEEGDAEPLTAAAVSTLRPGRVDAVLFGTVVRVDGVIMLRGRTGFIRWAATPGHEAYGVPLNACVAINGCGVRALKKRPRDEANAVLVVAASRLICEGGGESVQIEPLVEDAPPQCLFGEVLDVRKVAEDRVHFLVDDVDRGPVEVRAPAAFVAGSWSVPAFCDAFPWLREGDGGGGPSGVEVLARRLLGRFVRADDVVFVEDADIRVSTSRVVGARLVAVERTRPRRCRAARVALGDVLLYASRRLRTPPMPCSTYRVAVEDAKRLDEGAEVVLWGRVCIEGVQHCTEELRDLPLRGQHGAETLRGHLAQVRRCPLCASVDAAHLFKIGADAREAGALKVMERCFVVDDGTASIRCEWACCGCAARAEPAGEARTVMDGQCAVVRGCMTSHYKGFAMVSVASVRLAGDEEAPLWTLMTPRLRPAAT